MPGGIPTDQFGAGLVLSTAGAAVACLFSVGRASRRAILLRVLSFPPLAALVLAALLAPTAYPGGTTPQTVAPLALGSMGLQARLGLLRVRRVPLGLSFS